MRRFIESLKREGNEAIIEAVLNGYDAIFENNLMEAIGPVYHGTNDKFEKFDLDKTTMGDIWFNDNKETIMKGESGARGTKYIMERYLNIPEEKLAGWDLYDKYSLGELINMGYRGVKLPGEEGTDYIVFNPDDIVKKENLYESERTGGKKLSEYPRYQYANSVTIFRARNTNDTTFNTNDYVTLSPKFAVEHAESTHVYEEEPQQVIKANVKPDLIVDASNPGEYFYIGEPIEGKSVYTTKGEEYEGNIPNLMEAVYGPVYHGSPNDFKEFSYKYLGTNGTLEGYGFYFTTSKSIAERYTESKGKLFKAYITIRKPLSPSRKTITKSQLTRFLKALDPDGQGYLSNWGDVNHEGYFKVMRTAVNAEYDGSNNDVEMISGIINAEGRNPESIYPVLTKTLGYDGIIAIPEWAEGETIIIPFTNEQIKQINS